MTTAKKTMLKNVLDSSTWSSTGKVASTTGTAPRSPAQPSTTRSAVVKRSKAVLTKAATGRATNTSTSASAVPLIATSPSSLGNTSSPSARNIAICATQASPWWNTVTVRLAGMRAEPSTSPATYTARKPGSVQRVGRPEGDRGRRQRGDRIEPGASRAWCAAGP